MTLLRDLARGPGAAAGRARLSVERCCAPRTSRRRSRAAVPPTRETTAAGPLRRRRPRAHPQHPPAHPHPPAPLRPRQGRHRRARARRARLPGQQRALRGRGPAVALHRPLQRARAVGTRATTTRSRSTPSSRTSSRRERGARLQRALGGAGVRARRLAQRARRVHLGGVDARRSPPRPRRATTNAGWRRSSGCGRARADRRTGTLARYRHAWEHAAARTPHGTPIELGDTDFE